MAENKCAFQCINKGHCVEHLGRFMCNCLTGFTGDACQLRAYDEYMMFVTDKDYQGMYEDAQFLNTIYQNITIALGFVVIIVIICSCMLSKRYQTRVVKMNKSQNQLVKNLSSSGLISIRSDHLFVTTQNWNTKVPKSVKNFHQTLPVALKPLRQWLMEELGSMSTDKSKNRSSFAETDSQLRQRVTFVITP